MRTVAACLVVAFASITACGLSLEGTATSDTDGGGGGGSSSGVRPSTSSGSSGVSASSSGTVSTSSSGGTGSSSGTIASSTSSGGSSSGGSSSGETCAPSETRFEGETDELREYCAANDSLCSNEGSTSSMPPDFVMVNACDNNGECAQVTSHVGFNVDSTADELNVAVQFQIANPSVFGIALGEAAAPESINCTAVATTPVVVAYRTDQWHLEILRSVADCQRIIDLKAGGTLKGTPADPTMSLQVELKNATLNASLREDNSVAPLRTESVNNITMPVTVAAVTGQTLHAVVLKSLKISTRKCE